MCTIVHLTPQPTFRALPPLPKFPPPIHDWSLLPTPAQANHLCVLHPYTLPFVDISCKWNHTIGSLYDWLLSRSMRLPRITSVTACISSCPLLLLAWKYYILPFHQLVDSCSILGCYKWLGTVA